MTSRTSTIAPTLRFKATLVGTPATSFIRASRTVPGGAECKHERHEHEDEHVLVLGRPRREVRAGEVVDEPEQQRPGERPGHPCPRRQRRRAHTGAMFRLIRWRRSAARSRRWPRTLPAPSTDERDRERALDVHAERRGHRSIVHPCPNHHSRTRAVEPEPESEAHRDSEQNDDELDHRIGDACQRVELPSPPGSSRGRSRRTRVRDRRRWRRRPAAQARAPGASCYGDP